VVENVERSLADATSVGCTRCLGEVQIVGAEALARVGHTESARKLLRDYVEARHEQTRIVRAWRARAEAALAAAEGDRARSAGMLALVEAEELSMGWDLDALWCKIDRGRDLATVDRGAAIKVLDDAARNAERLGAKTEELVAEKLLRSLGQRTWRRGPSTDALTDREREIVKLVAEGASNPEIAQRLFLSRKTIERHISNALRKVGARNRAELAARASELGVEGAPR
jgi:DNA-binding CsgD family transcriptional regulator